MDSRALGLLGFMHANHPQLSTLRWPESSVGLGDESSVGPQYDTRWVGSRFSASDASPMWLTSALLLIPLAKAGTVGTLGEPIREILKKWEKQMAKKPAFSVPGTGEIQLQE